MSKTEPRRRFKNLTLKKNLIKDDSFINNTGCDSHIIVLDDSMEYLRTPNITKLKQMKVYSPIVIEDSDESNINRDSSQRSLLQEINYNTSIYSLNSTKHSITENAQSKPSLTGWSPAQNIICATPKQNSLPSTPREKANESLTQCSMNKIERSQKKILDELYGEVWKSIPTLFKTQPRLPSNDLDGITKKLTFDDEDSDKENNTNIKEILSENKRLYLTSSSNKKLLPPFENGTEKKSKKKLYTEVTVTPDVKRTRNLKKEPNTTSKKLKGKSVTELVEILAKEKELQSNNSAKSASNKVKNCKSSDVDTVLSRLTFVGSLSDNVPLHRRAPEAYKYIDNYSANKEKLCRRLFKEFNKKVFDEGLDADLPILWDTKLRCTAGTTSNRQIKKANGERVRTSAIKLSTKVVDCAQRLRDTLIHEMCHAATWIIDHTLKAGHGPLWKKWAKRALQVYPELGDITVCHSLDIHYKYTYRCTGCGYCIRRHSKSIDVTKKCCGYCRNKFEIILNKKTKDGVVSTPARVAPVNGFAKFVKQNYAGLKEGRSHAEVMKALGEQFSKLKTVNVN